MALDMFLAKKAEIDAALDRLAKLSADHYGVDPDNVGWGDVADLGYIAEKLKEITDFAFNEVE